MLELPEQEKKAQRVELTERDLSTLQWIGEQYAIRFDQLQRLLGQQAGPGIQTPGMLSGSSVRVWITRMKTIGAIETEKPYRTQPPYAWLTNAGLRLIDLDFKPLKPAISTLNHIYWCNQARLFMAARRPNDQWIPERQLRSMQAQATNTLHRRPELPDAHLFTKNGIIALEVELTDKQATRLATLMRKRVSEYYTVWYFCSQETYNGVEAAKKGLPAETKERVQVYALQQLE